MERFAYPDVRKYSIRFQDSFLVLMKWRRVVRETPIILAMDAMPTSFFSSSRISSSFPSSFDLPNAPLGLPIAFPFARAVSVYPQFFRLFPGIQVSELTFDGEETARPVLADAGNALLGIICFYCAHIPCSSLSSRTWGMV